jgi:serine/threonine protein kinase
MATMVCPEREELERLLLGMVPLSEDEARCWERHLSTCPRCDQLAQELAADDHILDAMRAQPTEPQPGPGAVQELIGRLKELPSSHTGAARDTPVGDGEDPSPGACHPAESFDYLAPPERPDELGRLGPYRVLRQLGAGGMGVVFEAEDPQLQRSVALKVIRPALMADAAIRERFLREARATAALQHDHIVTVYHVGEDRGVLFLAMQLLQGETLDDRLAREGRLPAGEVIRIGREIAEGLAAAHAQGLIHRDVKPANVWLELGTSRVKLLDFGLARIAADEAGLSHHGLILGTPHYMAPEQAEGVAIDARADLFSLGCVLHQACTGELPFRGSGTLGVLRALATQTPRPARALNATVPPGLSRLIQKLMAKDPADRPSSAAVVAGALAAVERGGSGRPRVSCRWVAVAASLLLAGLGLTTYLHTTRPAPPTPDEPPPAPEGKSCASVEPGTVPVLREIRRFEGHSDIVWSVAFSPDGNRALTGSGMRQEDGKWLRGEDRSVRLWEVETGRLLRKFDAGERVLSVGFAGQGRTALASRYSHVALRWDLGTGEALPSLTGEPFRPFDRTAYSQDGRLALSAGQDAVLRLWDVDSGQQTAHFAGPPEVVHCMVLSPDSRLAATAGGGQFVDRDKGPQRARDFSVRIWDLEARTELRRLEGHRAFVWSVAFSADGRWLLSGGADKLVQLWEVQTGKPIRRFDPPHSILALAFSPDGRRALSGSSDTFVRLLDVETGRELCRYQGHTKAVRAVAFSPNGRLALSGGADGTVRLWQVPRDGESVPKAW